MLFGEYHHALDAQNRVSVPAAMRAYLGQDFMIVRDIRLDPCLRMYPADKWEAYMDKIREKMDRKDSDKAFWFLYRDAIQVTPDSLGRVRLTKELLKVAKIDPEQGETPRNVLIVGCGEFGQIWTEENYAAHNAAVDERALLRAIEESGL